MFFLLFPTIIGTQTMEGIDTMFDSNLFYSYLLKGNIPDAMRYIKECPDQIQQYTKYKDLFEDGHFLDYGVTWPLQQILDVYQQYFRDVFYLQNSPEAAEAAMLNRFSELFKLQPVAALQEQIKERICEAFSSCGYHILCGKTSGYYGPYIWNSTETTCYDVELPDGIQRYTIRFLDGFLCRSWLDYISFGQIGTGGWTGADGIINCVKAAYHTESEHFRVSLLKHEAQHALDLADYPSMSSTDLEYRAKLVELIYSQERNLLDAFRREADTSHSANGHSMAASRISEEFFSISDPSEIRQIAWSLFQKSNTEMAEKYEKRCQS